MPTKQFFLLGESPSSARDIELPSQIDQDDLRYLIASQFAIVDPHGVGFESQDAHLTVADVLASEQPVAISIDGKAVREVPGPKGLPYVGNYFEIYPDHLGNHQRLFEKYGPMIKTTNFGSVMYSTNDPKLANIAFAESDFFAKTITKEHPLHPIKDKEAALFLGDTDTEQWRTAHKFLPPALGPKAVRHYAPSMQQTVDDSFKVFDELDRREEAWNVYPYAMKLASQSVGKLVLGMDFEHFSSVDAPPHEMIRRIVESLELNKKISSMGSWYAKLPFGPAKQLVFSMQRCRELLAESIMKAARGTEDLDLQEAALTAENMVDYILRAVDAKGNKIPQGKMWSPLFVITGAGFVTTASLLSWLIYRSVTCPELQERLLQELIDNGIDADTQINADLVGKLTFLDKFVKETQRTNNPAYQPARTAKVDMILPGGYKLAKGSVLIVALHHMHHNPNVWSNPTRFEPDRWDSEGVKNRASGSYLPFGTGPRGCIGFNFALMEVKVFLARLIYRYRFSLATDGPIDYDPMFQVIIPNNLYVRAERRVKWPPRSDA
ncbi:cytochrome P450 [Xylaria nigripes]|nr:cytochrome P450 [Xylaria nigripes]